MRLTILAATFALTACATANDDFSIDDMFAPVSASAVAKVEASGAPLGSKGNPVRASMPPGQRAYLDRLRCSDGKPPAYQRGGNVGDGPYGKIVDVYMVTCAGAQPASAEVHMDMYHDHVEDRPVAGFTIVPR